MNPETQSAIPMQMKRRHTVRVFNIITSSLLALSCVCTVGIFLYKDHVTKELSDARIALREVSSSKSEENARKVEEIRVYDNKLTLARTLLEDHLAPSVLLAELEKNTKETVQYSSFEYAYDPGYDVMLTLNGTTKELSSVSLQKGQFIRDGIFSEFVISDISTAGIIAPVDSASAGTASITEDKNEGAGFVVKGIFKKKLLAYTGMPEIKNFSETVTEEAAHTFESASTSPDNNLHEAEVDEVVIPDNI